MFPLTFTYSFDIVFIQSTDELQQKLKSYMMTSFRMGIGASRIAEVLNHRLGLDERVSCLFFLETGTQATLPGEGYLLEEFKRTGKISNFSGSVSNAKTIYDRDFKDAAFCTVKFDETYYYLHYDCAKSTHFLKFYVPQ